MSWVGQGFCPVCGGFYATRKDGMIRKHSRFYWTNRYSQPTRESCPGSGKPPRFVDQRPAE